MQQCDVLLDMQQCDVLLDMIYALKNQLNGIALKLFNLTVRTIMT